MKKTYISPTTRVLQIESSMMLALSMVGVSVSATDADEYEDILVKGNLGESGDWDDIWE